MPNYDRWQLKTAPQLNIGEIKYNNISQPQDQSPTLAKTSAQETQERRRTYSEQRTKIDDAFSEMSKFLHHDAETDNWVAQKKSEVEARIKNFTAAGNYEGALNAARESAHALLSDAEYQGRIKNNTEYEEARKTVLDRFNRGDITSDQLEYWNDVNQFKTTYQYNDAGEITGTKPWEQTYNPVHKVNNTEFIRSVLSILQPNSVSNSSSSSKGSSNESVSTANMADYDKANNLKNTGIRDNGALVKTGSSYQTESSRSRQETELTADRLINALKQNLQTNPEVYRAYVEQFNIAQHMYDKYNKKAAEATRNGDAESAEEFKRRAATYKAQIVDDNGSMIHDPHTFILKEVVTKSGDLYKYHTIATSTAFKTFTGRTLGVNPVGPENNTTTISRRDPITGQIIEETTTFSGDGKNGKV